MLTGWHWLDPLISLLIALVIIAAGWGLLRDSLHLTMAVVPRQIDARSAAGREGRNRPMPRPLTAAWAKNAESSSRVKQTPGK